MPRTRQKRWTRRSEAEIRGLLEEMDRSGVSQRAFAEKSGVPLSTLTWWRRKLRGGPARRSRAGDLIPVVLSPRVGPQPPLLLDGFAGFEVELRSGHVLRVPANFDAAGLESLVSVLDRPC